MESQSIPRVPPPPARPGILFGLSLVTVGLNFVYAPISIVIGSALMAYMVWHVRAEYIPAILILPLGKSDFLLSQRGTWEYMVMQFESNAIYIGGFPISINYILIATLVLRVTYEFFNRSQTFRNAGVLWLVPLWYLAMLPALLMSFQGRMEGNPSWTQPIRVVAISGALFYGVIVVRSWAADGRVLLRWILPITIFATSLGSVGLFHNRILWLLIPFSIPMAWLAFRQKEFYFKIMGMVCAVTSAAYGLGLIDRLKPVTASADAASGLLGQSTFTLNALFLSSIAFTAILALPFGGLRRSLSWFLGWPIILVLLGFTITVGLLSPSQTRIVANSSFARIATADMTPLERLRAKVFDDRSIIWYSALKDIATENPFLLPAGRLMPMEHPSRGLILWPVGMHNTPLHVMRILRWIAGPIVLLILFSGALSAAKSIGKPIPSSLRVLSAGTVSSVIVGGVTGHYLVGSEVAFFFFAFAGMAAGATAAMRTSEATEARLVSGKKSGLSRLVRLSAG